MNQIGYLIQNLLDKKTYFTSSSAYDRPTWVEASKATSYVTAELAESAKTKLIRNGIYSIRLVPLSEALPLPTEITPPSADIPIEPGSPQSEGGDEMVASQQDDVCPECEHSPCTCEDDTFMPGDNIDVEQYGEPTDVDPIDTLDPLDPNNEFQQNKSSENEEEITTSRVKFDRGSVVSHKGEEYIVAHDDGTGTVSIVSKHNPSNMIRVNVNDLLPIHENSNTQLKESTETTPDDEKIKVPSELKSSLKKVANDYNTEANEQKDRDDTRASFCMTVSDAATEILGYLNTGTQGSLKQAQIRMSSMMNAITSNFPSDVVKFINSGGSKPTLKTLFDDKRNNRKD